MYFEKWLQVISNFQTHTQSFYLFIFRDFAKHLTFLLSFCSIYDIQYCVLTDTIWKTSFLDEHWCDKSEWETISTLTAVYCLLASHMPLTGYYNGSRSQNIKFRRSTCCSVFLHMAKQMRHFFSVSLQFFTPSSSTCLCGNHTKIP